MEDILNSQRDIHKNAGQVRGLFYTGRVGTRHFFKTIASYYSRAVSIVNSPGAISMRQDQAGLDEDTFSERAAKSIFALDSIDNGSYDTTVLWVEPEPEKPPEHVWPPNQRDWAAY